MGEATMPAGGRRQRKVRNFLLDRGFQLKYAGYLVAIAFLLSASLGVVLWRTSEAVVDQSRQNVARGEEIVTLGKEVVSESRKVSAVVQMNIVKDPIYQDNPDLLAAFEGDAKAQDDRLAAQQAGLERQRQALATDAARLERFQRTMLFTLVGVLALLVLALGAAGIVVTHKVAGPLFKMKRHLADIAAGNFATPGSLRKGDELVDFFQALRDMIDSLRGRTEEQLALIDSALEGLEGRVEPEQLASLKKLRADLLASIA